MATAPRSLPEKSVSDPNNRPMGVRAPATITDVVMSCLLPLRLSLSAVDLPDRLTNRPVERLPLRYDH